MWLFPGLFACVCVKTSQYLTRFFLTSVCLSSCRSSDPVASCETGHIRFPPFECLQWRKQVRLEKKNLPHFHAKIVCTFPQKSTGY